MPPPHQSQRTLTNTERHSQGQLYKGLQGTSQIPQGNCFRQIYAIQQIPQNHVFLPQAFRQRPHATPYKSHPATGIYTDSSWRTPLLVNRATKRQKQSPISSSFAADSPTNATNLPWHSDVIDPSTSAFSETRSYSPPCTDTSGTPTDLRTISVISAQWTTHKRDRPHFISIFISILISFLRLHL